MVKEWVDEDLDAPSYQPCSCSRVIGRGGWPRVRSIEKSFSQRK
jgi:hypothetical protein